ncbi:lipopolysaccharide biosynthesis protein [Haloferax sp. ATB1]|uniref:lipopolysaccharide biosynthesis protein n=1 Tax=Haloferax sp. ATB1 TaxID=1508454 RepID=UPI000693F1B4|nr:oligosaccharide flippase family protein [Haloferax sp. ATB1]
MDKQTEGGVSVLATQGSITLFGNICGKVLGFVFAAIATRLVDPTDYGIYTLALSIVIFIQGFASLNIYRSVDFFIPQFINENEYGKAKMALRNVIIIGLLSSMVGLAILLLSASTLDGYI